jgi:predicted nucleic acid-binding protein
MNPIFEAPVVCNAGPLIGLARVNLAWLPFRLFPEVIVPEEVRVELLVKESPDRSQLIKAWNWRASINAMANQILCYTRNSIPERPR